MILLSVSVALLAVAVVLLTVGALTHHLLTARRRRRFASRLNAAATFLAPHVVSREGLADAVFEARRRFGPQPVAAALRRWRSDVDGAAGEDISRVLVEIGELGSLSRAAGSQRNEQRLEAIRGLAEYGSAVSQEILVDAADGDAMPEVRRAAREGLLSIHSSASVRAATRTYLKDSRRGIGWDRGFFAHLAEAAPAHLRELIGSGQLTHDEERLALEALGDASDGGAVPLARAWLPSSDPELRATAARVLGKLRDADSAPAILALLRDPVWFVRVAAAKALEGLPADGPVSEALSRALSDPEWWVRARAAHALSCCGRLGIEALLDAVGGSDRYARDAALAALGRRELPPESKERLAACFITLEAMGAGESEQVAG